MANRSNLRRKYELWISLYQSEDNFGFCHWCEIRLVFSEATFDHEPALGEGGFLEQGVISCERCNKDRGKESDKRVKEKDCQKRVSLDLEADARTVAARIMRNTRGYRRAFLCPRCGKWHISERKPSLQWERKQTEAELDKRIKTQWERMVTNE